MCVCMVYSSLSPLLSSSSRLSYLHPFLHPLHLRPRRLAPLSASIGAATPSPSLLGLPSLADKWQYLLSVLPHDKWQPYFVALAPVAIASSVSYQLRIGLEGEIQVAVLRSFVQLLTLGLVLKLIFEGKHLMWSVLGVGAMVLLAGYTAGEQAKSLPKSQLVASISLALGTLGSVGLMALLKVFPVEANIIIPVTAHILGNSMIMVGGTLKTLQYEVSKMKGQIEAALALGATPQIAVEEHIRRAFTIGMAPMVDAIKVMGLVSLPGNMTGMLMGGTSPMEAVKLQIKVMNVVLGAAAISCLISTLLGSRMLFTYTSQLREN